MIRSTYRGTGSSGTTAEEAELEARLWQRLFPEPFEMVLPAVEKCIETMHFRPVPADVREKMAAAFEDPDDTPERAWEIYYKTVCRLGSYNTSKDAWLSLPEKIRDITTPDEMRCFAYTSTAAEYGYIRSAFIKAYDMKKQIRRNEMMELPLHTVPRLKGGKE